MSSAKHGPGQWVDPSEVLESAFPSGVVDSTRLVQFFLPLPDPIPFPDRGIFTAWLPEPLPELKGIPIQVAPWEDPVAADSMFTSVCLYQSASQGNSLSTAFEAIAPVLEAVLGKPPFWRSSYRKLAKDLRKPKPIDFNPGAVTVAGVVTVLRGGAPADDELRDAINRALDWLQLLVGAYRARVGVPVRVPSAELLPSLVTFVQKELDPGAEWSDIALYSVGYPAWTLPVFPEPEDLHDWLGTYLDGLNRKHPTAVYREHLMEADVAEQREGDYRTAVVLLETALEVLIDALVGLLMWEQGAGIDEGSRYFRNNSGFKRRVQSLGSWLPGEWSATVEGPVAQWAEDLAGLRHRVVHTGHRPTHDEMVAARAALEALRNHATAQLMSSAQFPKTNLILLSRAYLERVGALSDEMALLADDLTQPDWLGLYFEWVDAVRAR